MLMTILAGFLILSLFSSSLLICILIAGRQVRTKQRSEANSRFPTTQPIHGRQVLLDTLPPHCADARNANSEQADFINRGYATT